MNDLEGIEKLKCELEEMKYINKELNFKLQNYENMKFQIVTREKAVLAFLSDSKVKVYQINVLNDYVTLISDITMSKLIDDIEVFYVIQKG